MTSNHIYLIAGVVLGLSLTTVLQVTRYDPVREDRLYIACRAGDKSDETCRYMLSAITIFNAERDEMIRKSNAAQTKRNAQEVGP